MIMIIMIIHYFYNDFLGLKYCSTSFFSSGSDHHVSKMCTIRWLQESRTGARDIFRSTSDTFMVA